MVNETLKVEMEKIHALSQKCLTPEQWAGQQAKASAPGKVSS
jgi:stress-induced morphogen